MGRGDIVERRTARGINIAAAGEPDAPPVVLVHGLGGSWHVWRSTIDLLAREHRVLAVDLPGFGRSLPPAGGYDLGTIAAELRTAIARAGRHVPVALVGHSTGGGIAARLALDFPQLVSRLVMLAPAGFYPGNYAPYERRSRLDRRMLHRLTILADPLLATSERMRRFGLARYAADPAAIPGRVAMQLARSSRTARSTGPAAVAILTERLIERAADLTTPTLLLWGDRDRVVDPAYGPRIAAALPDARLEVLERTGHLPMIERTREVAESIQGFLLGQRAH